MDLISKHYEIARIKSADEDLDIELHRHDYYELFFFFGGSGNHIIDFETYDLSQNCIQIVRPHQLHQVLQSTDSQGYVVKINPIFIQSNPLLLQFFNWINYNKNIQNGVNIQPKETAILLNACEHLIHLKEANLFSLIGFIGHYISFFKNNQQLKEKEDNDIENNFFTEFVALAESNYTSKKSADFYATQIYLSLNKLNTIVKGRTGMTVKRFLTERLLLEAKRLLVYSQKSVKEIAYELEFLEPPHFTNFFKKYTGETPSKFRIDFAIKS